MDFHCYCFFFLDSSCPCVKKKERSHKIKSIQDKKKNMQKETAVAREEMRNIREDIIQKEDMLLLSDKFAKNEMTEAEMEAELQGLQAEEERRGSNASQAVDCC